LRVLKPAPHHENNAGKTCVIIRRPYDQLKGDLEKTFGGQKDVEVVVDMRHHERRKSRNSVSIERRQGDRRRQRQELVEAVISI